MLNSNNIHLLSNVSFLQVYSIQNHCKESHNVEIDITEMIKRCQHITKLQSELIQEKMLIDLKLDETVAKHYYLEKTKYQLLPQVVIPTIASHVELTTVDKTLNTTLHTTPITPPNMPSKQIIHNILTKRPLSDTENGNVKRICKDVAFNFHDEIDDHQLLTAEVTQCENCCEQAVFYIISVMCTHVITYDSCAM